MKARRSTQTFAALLAVFVALAALPGVGRAQDERPDLKIELVGLDPADPRAVRLRVTNVGKWWADKTTATVEADPPSAGARVTQAVPDTGPEGDRETASQFEFTYPLAAACGGQAVKVKASLQAAATFNGNTETNDGDNMIPRAGQPGEVCAVAAAPQPASKPSDPAAHGIEVQGRSAGANAERPVPERLRPGLHENVPFVASAVSTALQVYRHRECNPSVNDLTGYVGYYQDEHPFNLGLACWWFAQTAVNFDLSELDAVPASKKTLKRAVLKFNETPDRWKDGAGRDILVSGCVEVLGRATVQWEGRDVNALVPNERVQGHSPGVREWYVTDDVGFQWFENRHPRFGFVLRGGIEDLAADDNRSCMSRLDTIRLEVTYEVST